MVIRSQALDQIRFKEGSETIPKGSTHLEVFSKWGSASLRKAFMLRRRDSPPPVETLGLSVSTRL